MNTKSITKFVNSVGDVCALSYKMYDGNLEDYGKDLAMFLNQVDRSRDIVEQVIERFKDSYYLYLSVYENSGNEIYYTIIQDNNKNIIMKVSDTYKEIFKGTPLEFLQFLELNNKK